MERQTKGSAGYDLRGVSLERHSMYTIVDTGIVADIPEGYFGMVVLRSSVSMKLGVGLVNGVGIIDSDYKHTVKLLFPPLTDPKVDALEVMIDRLERIAQMVIIPYHATDEVTNERGGGLGSTGR